MPSIGAPVADDLIGVARLRPGERVLDVACGTGVVTRLAAERVDLVFALHGAGELAELLRSAGFRDIDVQARPRTLRLPAPADFLWQYIHSTPLTEAVAQAGQAKRDALERDVCAKWQEFMVDGSMSLQVGMTAATARK